MEVKTLSLFQLKDLNLEIEETEEEFNSKIMEMTVSSE